MKAKQPAGYETISIQAIPIRHASGESVTFNPTNSSSSASGVELVMLDAESVYICKQIAGFQFGAPRPVFCVGST